LGQSAFNKQNDSQTSERSLYFAVTRIWKMLFVKTCICEWNRLISTATEVSNLCWDVTKAWICWRNMLKN